MLRDRLRVNYVSDTLYDDGDVLEMLNDAYLYACVESQCLRNLVEIPLLVGQQEYDLPVEYSQTIAVVSAGHQLQPVPMAEALLTQSTGYYTYSTRIGVMPSPATAGSLWLLYAARPAPLLTLTDPLDQRFPVEYADVLYHWVKWRTQLMSGGAERIQSATLDRSIYDTRVGELRQSGDTIEMLAPSMLGHVGARRNKALHA